MILIKLRQKPWMLIATVSIGLLPMGSFAKEIPIMTTDLLQDLKKGEPWDRGVLAATKMVMFQQTTIGSTNATSISKITLAYFTTANCTGTPSGGFYTTPDGTSFTISVGTTFGMVASSVWNVGSTKLSIADMTTIQSVAVTFKSTNNNTPQANFSGVSFACVPVVCTGGECQGTGTKNFTLKTTASIGDPVDGGVIACKIGGSNLVTPTTDNSTGVIWGSNTSVTTNTTDGASNTTAIVTANPSTPSYAAKTCSTYSAAGGFTSGWFLPASTQLNCLFSNRGPIGGFSTSTNYWSSTQNTTSSAVSQSFSVGTTTNSAKNTSLRVRCSRVFTP